MVLPLLLLQLSQSATPSSAVVVVTRRTAVSPADARALAARVSRELKQAQLEIAWEPDAAARRLAALGVKDSSTCQGRKQCVLEFGRQLDAAVVVGVSMSEVDGDRSVSLEAFAVSDGEELARENLLYGKGAAVPGEQLAAFAAHLKTALSPPAPAPAEKSPPVADAPKTEPARVLEPAPVPLVILQAPLPPPEKSHAASIVLGGGTVLAVAAAATLAVLAFGAKNELTRGTALADGRTASALTGSEAIAVSNRANGELYGAIGCAVLGVGLGTAAAVAW